jgi:hypothetical protein
MSSRRSLEQRMTGSTPPLFFFFFFFFTDFVTYPYQGFLFKFFFGQISHHLDQKLTALRRRRRVQRKKRAKLAIFWGWTRENLPFLDNEFLEVARTKRDSKHFYFLVYALAKFGSFIFWMIASSPTWQNWKKNLDLHMAISGFLGIFFCSQCGDHP